MKTLKTFSYILLIAGLMCNCIIAQAQDKKAKDLAELTAMDNIILKKQWIGHIRTQSGLQYQELSKGKGNKPKSNSYVKIKYTLLTFGAPNIPMETIARDKIWEGRLDETLYGMQEVLKMMQIGSKFSIKMPAKLCAGKAGKVGGGRALFGNIELLAVK